MPKEQALKVAYIAALTKVIEKTPEEARKTALKDLVDTAQRELDDLKKSAAAK